MSLKTAEELGVVSKEDSIKCSNLAKDILINLSLELNNNVEASETMLKILYLFDKTLNSDFSFMFRKAVIFSIFKMWDIDAIQLAIDFNQENTDG